MSDPWITKNALASSLKNAMEKKPFNKIRISEIVEQCHLERQTFYYHFEDKYALVIWIFHQDTDQRSCFSEIETTYKNVYDMCLYFQEQKDFYKNLFLNGDKRVLRDMLYNALYERFYKELSTSYVLDNHSCCDFISNYLATGTSGLLIQWLLNDVHMELHEFSEYLYRIHHHILTNFPLQEMQYVQK